MYAIELLLQRIANECRNTILVSKPLSVSESENEGDGFQKVAKEMREREIYIAAGAGYNKSEE